MHDLAVVGDTVTNSGSGDVDSGDADGEGEDASDVDAVDSSGITAVNTWSSKSMHLQSSLFSNRLPFRDVTVAQIRIPNYRSGRTK